MDRPSKRVHRNHPSHRGGGRPPASGARRNNAHQKRAQYQQLLGKHLSLARELMAQGDRVEAESHFQHADHYYRQVQALEDAMAPRGFNGSGYPEEETGQTFSEERSDLSPSRNFWENEKTNEPS